MKFLIVFCLASAVLAKENYQNEIEFARKLMDDCKHIDERTLLLIDNYRKHGKQHLLETVIHLSKMIKMAMNDLDKNDRKVDTLNQLTNLHHIEERLLFLENRIDEEMDVVEEVIHYYQDKQRTVKEIIEFTKILYRMANDALEKNRVTYRNQEAVKFELQSLNKMLKRLELKHADAYANIDEERFERIRLSLRQLIKHLPPINYTTTTPKYTEEPTSISTSTESTWSTRGDDNTHTAKSTTSIHGDDNLHTTEDY